MVDQLDFRQEAKGCLLLAESETQAEVKTILMGMALGWLTLADQANPSAGIVPEPTDELTEGAVDTLA
jgi:hypothetical protein